MGRVNTQNRDGSEVRFAEIAKLWATAGHKLHIFLPPRETRVLKSQGVEGTNISFDEMADITNSELDTLANVLFIYATRLVKTLFKRYPTNVDTVYVPSDFLVDLVPGLLCSYANPKSRLVVCLFLIAPNPFKNYEKVYGRGFSLPSLRSLIYYATQSVAVRLVSIFRGTVLVLNDNDRQVLKGRARRITTVTMGVGLSEFNAIQPSSGTLACDGVYVGRLHPQKGLPDLIAIWKKVVAVQPEAKLAIIGGGSEHWKDWLATSIQTEGLSRNVDFLGFIAGEEKVKILKNAKVFIMPSHYESFGMTAIEAWASGLPVCAYDIPVFRSVFADAPVYAPFEDIDAFADNVLKCLRNMEFSAMKARQGRLIAEEFDWPKVAARELEIIQDAA